MVPDDNAVPLIAYGVNDAAIACGLTRSEVYRLLAAGKLKAKKNGRRTLIPASEVQRWLRLQPMVYP